MPQASSDGTQRYIIKLKVYSPYHTWTNEQHEVVLQVAGQVTVQAMLALLGTRYPRFATLANCDEVAIRNQFALICNGRVLALNDPVPYNMTIDLVPPLSGG